MMTCAGASWSAPRWLRKPRTQRPRLGHPAKKPCPLPLEGIWQTVTPEVRSGLHPPVVLLERSHVASPEVVARPDALRIDATMGTIINSMTDIAEARHTTERPSQSFAERAGLSERFKLEQSNIGIRQLEGFLSIGWQGAV